MKDGTFVPIHESKLKRSTRVSFSGFIDELKKVGDKLKNESGLVAQNYADEEENYIETKEPTAQNF